MKPHNDILHSLVLALLFGMMALALAGCTVFDNRIACSLDQDEAYFVSKYAGFGITSSISEKDVPHLCGKR
jgi:hypothetical protein